LIVRRLCRLSAHCAASARKPPFPTTPTPTCFTNLFRGVYPSFDAAPPTRPLGYDNADAAGML